MLSAESRITPERCQGTRVLTRQQVNSLMSCDVFDWWRKHKSAALHENEPEHQLEELAHSMVAAEWLARWQSIATRQPAPSELRPLSLGERSRKSRSARPVQPAPDLVVGKDRDGCSGLIGGRIMAMGEPSISPLSSSQRKSYCSDR